MKLSDSKVAELKLPPGKSDAIYFDNAVAGFGVRLREGCRPIWIYQYRVGARQRRYQLGPVAKLGADAARKHAKKLEARVTLGEDPQAEKIEKAAATSHSFKGVVDLYLAARRKAVELGKLRPNTFTEVDRYLRKHWSPLHRLDVDAVDRRRVAVLLNKISAESGSTAAARARSALQSMYVWGMREGIVRGENPVIGTNTPETAKPRDRVLDDGEIADVWAACRDDDYGRILKLLLLTGQRRQEIGGLRWSEIDLEHAVIKLPPERTKNGKPHVIPLSPLALQIIGSVPRRGVDRDHLFGYGGIGFNGWHVAGKALDERVQARRKKAGLPAMKEWRVHDLRRTCASGMGDIGIPPHVVEAALNHASGAKRGVAGVYNRSTYEKEVKTALSLWADHIRVLVEGGERKIVPLHVA